MGLSSLRNMVDELLEVLPPTKPVAVIHEGTMEGQKVLLGTLSDIVEKVEESGIRPPAIIVIGDVVNLRDRLWKKG
jgi:siroheme synthase